MSPTPTADTGAASRSHPGGAGSPAKKGRAGAPALLLVLGLLAAACTASPTAHSATPPTRRTAPSTTRPTPVGQLVFAAPRPVASGAGLDSVSCATPTSCVAVDANGGIHYFQGSTWSGPVTPASGPIGQGAISVSCGGPTLCAAVPTAGSQVVTGTGLVWSAPQTLPGATDLGAVGCAPTGYCATVDAEGYAFAFDDGRWTATSGDWGSVSGISCVSSTFCVSVSGGISQWDGSSWTQPDSYAATGSFTSVTCPTSSFCAAAISSGDVMLLNGQTWGTPVRIESGQPSATSVGPSPTGISCASSTYCAAVDSAGDVLQWSGTTWSSIDADPGHHLTAISCPTATFCAAVDSAGDVLLGHPA